MAEASKATKSGGNANPQNVAQKSIQESSLRRAISRWNRMTDENEHGAVRASISKYFGYDDLNKSYKAINKEHNRVGYLNGNLYQRRSALDEEMRRRITRDYGEGIRRMVF